MVSERPHKRLKAWERSVALVTRIYEMTRSFPKDEQFGLVAQLRRSAVSVPSNLAEGLTRRTPKDRVYFMNLAQSSLSEVDTQLEISARLGYIDQASMDGVAADLVEVGKLISVLSRSFE